MNAPKLKLLVGAWHLLRQVMQFGNPTLGGFTTMHDALVAVARLNQRLKKEFNIEFAVSGHWWHEILVSENDPAPISRYDLNNPRGIFLDRWIEGVKSGMYPRIGRLIPPGFGLPWSDEGAFTNPDPTRRALAEDMVIRSFAESERVMSEKVGEGHVIFWTGPDGICWRRLVDGKDIRLGHKLNPKLKEWNHVVSGLADAIKKSRARGYVKTKLLFEPKFAGDPCWIDVFTDTELAILGINQINKLVGEKVVWWQDEFCHARGGGRTFTNALRQAIKADVFDGNIHLNSGQLGRVDFAKLLARRGGTLLSEFPPAVDPDFLPGQGVQEWVADQVDTIWLCNHWSAKTGKPAEIEFDARFARHADTIGELEKSARWVIGVFNDATALPSVDHG